VSTACAPWPFWAWSPTQGHVPLTVLTALTFLVGSGEAFFEPSYGALLPAVVPADLLTSANAVSSVSRRVASTAGPALAGIILVAAGSGAAFLLNGLTFAVNMLTLLLLREPARNRQAEPMSMLGEVVEGVQALRARPWVAAMIGVGTLQLFLVVAPETVLLPVVAREHLGGNQAYALTLSAAAVGGLLGSLLALRREPRRPGTVAMLGLCLTALAPLALATPFSLSWVVAAYALAGFAVDPFLIYWTAGLQREFPPPCSAGSPRWTTSAAWRCSPSATP